MLQPPPQIFILSLFEDVDLAFEADSQESAEGLCRTSWFVQAVDQFRAHKRESASSLFYQARPATDAEAAIYRQIADEFAEWGDRLLVANLGDLSEPAR
jgi:hypothetical protein